MRALAFLIALCVTVQAQAGWKPQPAHGRFTTTNYTLTFAAPPALTYCPVPKDWVGSDHGTILFLIPPRSCTGVGYAASGRGAVPAGLPHIEIYYGYRDPGESPLPPCRRAGKVRLLGRERPLCAGRNGASVARTATGLYRSDAMSEISLTLVTTPRRLARDMVVFTRLVESIRTCTSNMVLPGGKHFGSGPRCKRGDFY